MDRDNLPAKVVKLMEAIEKSARNDRDTFEQSCEELEQYAKQNRSDYLNGFCLFYRGLISYADAELEDSMGFLSEALNKLISGEDWTLASRTYNAMGNIADFQGDASLAIDCYIKGLSMSREHDILRSEFDICSNIANVYLTLNDPANAAELLFECERIGERIEKNDPEAEIIVCANLCQSLLHLGRTEEASKKLDKLKSLCSKFTSSITDISIYILETELFHATGDYAARDAAIKKLNETKLSSINVFDALNELCRHCTLLLNINKIDEFLMMLDRIDFLANGPAVEKYILELRLSYYEKIGDVQSFREVAGNYYTVSRIREAERNKIICHNITSRIRLYEEENRRKEVEISNLHLKQKSEHDPLTGLHNRYKLNEMAELAFHRAYLNGTPLTIEILDVDCYKQFNDNYGHQCGDDCLIRIAEAIQSMEEYDGVHTARYGGDEFVIIYEEYSKRDIEKMAQRLHEKIRNLNIEHKYSQVSNLITISQGLFHKIPSGGNKTWDFLYAADLALYSVKTSGKNNYYIGTDFDGVRAHYKESRVASGKV